MLTLLDEFLLLFHELKRRTREDPERLRWLYAQSKQLQEIVDKLDCVTHVLDDRLQRSPKKYLTQVPPSFPDAFTDYKQRYKERVENAWLDNFRAKNKLDLNELDHNAAKEGAVRVDKPTSVLVHEEQEDSQEGYFIEEFNPKLDDPYDKFSGIISWAQDKFESDKDWELAEPALVNLLSEGLGAFDHFVKVIGVDLEGIARRWKQVPHMFIPQHVSDRHELKERRSLYDLHNDAVRAYVFGAPMAATAMCRALCEDVLKRHYELDTKKYAKLSKIISSAEEEYKWIRPLGLGQKVEHVNRLLHSYDRATKKTAAEEKTVLDFLTAVKTLIEKAPG